MVAERRISAEFQVVFVDLENCNAGSEKENEKQKEREIVEV